MINVDVSAKKIRYGKKISFGILLHVVVKMVKYLASIFDDDLMIRCDEIIKNEKLFQQILINKATYKTKIFIFYLNFY